jgi:arylsulfatase A-like enzyme
MDLQQGNRNNGCCIPSWGSYNGLLKRAKGKGNTNMRPLNRLIGVCAPVVLAWVQTPLCAESAPSPRGAILVVVDDIGYGDIDALYPSSLETPHIDSLHEQSLRLTDFHVGSSCSPSRASLMTGRSVNAGGVWHTIAGREILREDEQTMAEVFRANGWKTGIFGKWHLGEGYPFSARFRGFDGLIEHIDDNVGKLGEFLAAEGIKDDILLIFTSDNGSTGPRLGGLRGRKISYYDGGHNVPCFLRWKNGGIGGSAASARDVASLTAGMDLLPALMDFFDLDKPNGGRSLHGVSLKERFTLGSRACAKRLGRNRYSRRAV